MNALITGISAFILAALGTICPHDTIYVPALLSIVVAGGFVGGTIFSLQSDGVYDLHFRDRRSSSNATDVALGGIWAYGLVGIPAGAVALLIVARIAGIDDTAVANTLTGGEGVAGATRRVAACLGVFAVTVVGGFLGLNLIRIASQRLRAEIQREVSGQVAPLRLFDKGKLLMEERSYQEALEAFRALARQDETLLPIVWQGRALKRLGCLNEAIAVLEEGLKSRGAADEKYRRAVAQWNLACYKALKFKDSHTAETVKSAIGDLGEALQNAPEFKMSLGADRLDEDLAPLVGHPIFEEWRHALLRHKGSEHER